MISIKQLHYALAVEKTLHFKRAAELCNISQSTLSTAINELEKQLNTTIFERNNKQVLLTTAGKQILEQAKQVVDAMEQLLCLPEENNAPLTSQMTLGVIPTIGPYLLPKVLPLVRSQYPNFRLRIVEDNTQVLLEQLRIGELDAVLMALPYPIPGLLNFNFWEEDFYFVCHRQTCPEQVTGISKAQLQLENIMLLKEGHCLKDHVLNVCEMQEETRQGNYDTNSLHTLLQMVAGRMGTTLVPEMALQELNHNQSELKAIHIDEPSPHRVISFVIRPNYPRSDEIMLLKEIFIQSLKSK